MKSTLADWFSITTDQFLLVLLSTVVVYAAILLYTRIFGLRSFSKMSASDFAVTLAIGSVFASTISSPKPMVLIGLVTLACLYIGQWTLAWLRTKLAFTSKIVDNQPVLIMDGPRILDGNLDAVNMTRADLYAKLREANVYRLEQVLAVVFEATGDVSVLHTAVPDRTVAPELLSGVARAAK